MTIKIQQPELEKLVQEQLLSGHFQNVHDLLTQAINALREKSAPVRAASSSRKEPRQFLRDYPLAGSDLNLERQKDYGAANRFMTQVAHANSR